MGKTFASKTRSNRGRFELVNKIEMYLECAKRGDEQINEKNLHARNE